MLFTQERSAAGERRMRDLTRDLVDAALAVRGTYYLPYRLHATSDQFRRAYPMADRFFALKHLGLDLVVAELDLPPLVIHRDHFGGWIAFRVDQ